jgi:flavin-dependent dehydrogenase
MNFMGLVPGYKEIDVSRIFMLFFTFFAGILVGDAGYFKDPLTAHGISDALRDAELLTQAAVQGTDRAFIDYQTTRDYLSLCLFEITDRIASLQWSMDELKGLHIQLSKEMNREVEALLDLDRETSNRLAKTA